MSKPRVERSGTLGRANTITKGALKGRNLTLIDYGACLTSGVSPLQGSGPRALPWAGM